MKLIVFLLLKILLNYTLHN